MDVESVKHQNSNGTTNSDPSSSLADRKSRCSKRRKRIIWLSIIAVILALAIIFLVLGLTVFKAKRPVIAVRSVSLGDLSFDITRLGLSFNLTLHVSLLVTNPNRIGFQYSASSALLKYDRVIVGEVPIPAGKIGPRQTIPMNVSLTLMADRLLADSNLRSRFISGSGGTLHFSTSTRISGHVRILFKIHVVSYSTCDLYIDILRRNIANQTCHYKTKL